jgi:tetratricopeptide (TPR) repeat protein/serine/threonine protein kinase
MPSERFHVYELLDPLPRGGPGRVHQGRVVDAGGPLEQGSLVLLRTVSLEDVADERVLTRLVEAHACARRIAAGKGALAPVDHGISVGASTRQFWSVAPWAEGRTLADVLRTTEIVPDPLTEAVVGRVAQAMAAAHVAGVVGLGLSPDSVLLQPDGNAVLVDPGFGPAVGPRWPGSGAAPAAMMCASPEVLRGATPDPRSDLYALGALLFRCMTGRWHRPEDAKALHVHGQDMDAVRPNDERPKCSLFLSEVAYALLRADREDRIASAEDLIAILRDRRKSAWWRTLHIDQDTHDDDATSRRAHSQEPPPTPIPEPARAPDEDWWSQRLSQPGPFAAHPSRCVGRDAEIGLLVEAALRLPGHGGAVAIVEGAAGVGKTRLLDAFLGRLGELPAHKRPFVLRGEHRRVGVGRPFGAFTEALTRFLHDDRIADAVGVAPLLGESAGIAATFAAVLSSEAPPPDAPPLDPENVPPTFLRCMRTLTARSPVVLLVENLQWADPEVLELFAYLARVAEDLPLLLVGTCRPPEGTSALAETVAAVRSLPHARAVRLGALEAERIAQIARELVAPESVANDIAARAHAASGGTPEALVETCRALAAEGHLVAGGDGLLGAQESLARATLPASVTEALRRRIARLSERERAFLACASVQGVAFDSEVARIASGIDVRAAAKVLADLTHRCLISGDGIARRFGSHALFDEVRASVRDADLASRHEATAAAFLESRNPEQLPPSRIHGILSYRVAWHYLLSGRAARGLLYVSAAVEHLRGTCRHGDGERLMALACRATASDSGRAAEMIDMLLVRSRFLAGQGRIVEQRETLEEALVKSRERRDLVRESRILFEAARSHHRLGEAAQADHHAKQALACAHRGGETEVEMRVHMWLAQAAYRESRWQDARAHFGEALEIARRRSDAVAESEVHHGLGLVAQAAGSFDQAEEEFRTALRAHRQRKDLAREADVLACLGSLSAGNGDLVQAEGCLRRSLAIHLSIGDGTGETRVLGLLAMVLQEGGCLVEAREAHRSCLDRARRLDARQSEVVALLNLATVDAALGRLDDARDSYGRALLGAQHLEDARLQGYALTGLGEVARQRGEFAVARGLLGRATAQFRRTQDPSGLAASLLAVGRLETFAGEPDTARAALVEAHRLAEQQNARQVSAVAESLLALLGARGGDSDDAERRMGESALALSDIRATDATVVEMLFLHSLVLRVLGRPVEANRKLIQAEVTLVEAVRGLTDADRGRMLSTLTPNREIVAGAEAARAAVPRKTPGHSETVAI